MKSSEIRNTFVDYFKRHGHTHVGSSSLIPENDPTLLFANAGMNQFKNAFLGIEKRDYTKAVTVQKCVRAGGKHNDLENVGFTARHHTFFEMLGNFSFGDYFKKDAIHFAWELLTKDLGIPKEKLYVTVFESDDEAADIWHKQEGIPRDRIFRLGEKDNFWRMGDTGPCGPCSEIFYDHGAQAGLETDPFKGIVSGQDRFIEIWNLVFMQFYEKAPGVMDPLPKPSVDTGSGLERVVAALQGTPNNYNTDLFLPMIDRACKLSGVDYVTDMKILAQNKQVAQTTAALRVLADHCRSTAFLIADGALPSNEGRGYVLRRIMRRALRFGHKLDESKSILPAMIESLIDHMGGFYPELKNRKDHILSTVRDEEQRFSSTLSQGVGIFSDELKKAQSRGEKSLSGEIVFKLYDTFGFPVDLTKLMAEEHGLTVDETAFEKQMEQARTLAKSSWKGQAIAGDEAHLLTWAQEVSKPTKFVGYDSLQSESQILGLSNGTASVKSLTAGQTGFVILNQSPFYAEGGGQVGDVGEFISSGLKVTVHNCIKKTIQNNDIFIHSVTVEAGTLKISETITAQVSQSARRNTAANHSATHLMHAALREVLGTHVTQAGSSVDNERLRFDFTHNKPLSPDEVQKIEKLVNEQIGLSNEVSAKVVNYKEAIGSGAMALFGEKYGDQVRVLRMGSFSCELCGGTHVSNTSQIRFFKITSESGVSSGVRRIEAITGEKAIAFALHNIAQLDQARASSGLTNSWQDFQDAGARKSLATWIEDKKSEVKNLEKEIKKLQGAQVSVDDLVQKAQAFGTNSKFVFADLAIDDREVLAQITDTLKNKVGSGIVVVVGHGETSHPIIVSLTKDLVGTYKAGDLLKEIAAVMGGKGGGRPDFAQGAAPDRTQINAAKAQVQKILK